MTHLLNGFVRVVLALVMSTALVRAHEIEPTVADVAVTGDAVTVELRTAVEPLIVGIDMSAVEDTDDSPLSDRHDALRALPPEALEAELRNAWPAIAARLSLLAGETPLELALTGIAIPQVGDVEARRDTVLTLTAPLPADGSPVRVGVDGTMGQLIVRQQADGDAYEGFLSGGELSEPMPRDAVAAQSAGALFVEYLWQGILHIIPLGLDHILFVLGLFFYALAWRAILWQVTAFTLAHTVTLAMAVLGLVSVPGSVVEPLIALSITVVAVENVLRGGRATVGWGRIAIVFAFGLLHGLGFASVFGDLDVGGNLILKLLAFNVGVEIGQLAVIAAAFLAVGLWFGARPWYRKAIAIPASVVIGLVGLWWFLERTVLA